MSAGAQDMIAAARARTDVYFSTVTLKRNGNWHKGLCPFHQDREPSFAIKGPYWTCFSGCGHGDVIAFVMRLHGLSFAEAVKELTGDIADSPRARRIRDVGGGPRVAEAPRGPQTPDPGMAKRVASLWEEATASEIARTYLRSRGLAPKLGAALRGHPGVLYSQEVGDDKPDVTEPWRRWWSDRSQSWWQGVGKPATIAAITDAGGQVTAAHVIWCEPTWVVDNGAAPAKGSQVTILKLRKKTYGRMGVGAVRLSEPSEILGLAEGVESALSAAELYAVPVWATCGASRLGNVQLPDCVRRVIVFGDNGSRGEDATAAAYHAYNRRGYQVEVAIPDPEFGDWNDVLRAKVFGQ